MRKLYILGMILGMYATFSACNDEWKDELYTQMLSFKAPLGDNGLSEIYVRYQPDGTGIYQLPGHCQRLEKQQSEYRCKNSRG